MRSILSLLLLLCLMPTPAAAAPDPKATKALDALFDADWERQLRENPIGASYFVRLAQRWLAQPPSIQEPRP